MRGEVQNRASPSSAGAIQARVLALPDSALPVPASSDVGIPPPTVALAVQDTQAPARPATDFKSDKADLLNSTSGKTTSLQTSTSAVAAPVALPPSPVKIAVPVPAALPTPPARTGNDGIKDSATLDSRPKLLSDVVIEYPLAANNREGVVTLELTLAISGKVDQVEVLKATSPGFFESAAIRGFQGAQFTPGLFQGLGVKARLIVEVEFMPTNRGGSVAGPK
jgi:TonB family protein